MSDQPISKQIESNLAWAVNLYAQAGDPDNDHRTYHQLSGEARALIINDTIPMIQALQHDLDNANYALAELRDGGSIAEVAAKLKRENEALNSQIADLLIKNATIEARIFNAPALGKLSEKVIIENIQLSKENEALREALDQITRLGGNLSDDRLTEKTGPNDAVQRGIMYTSARQVARDALQKWGE